MDHNLITIDWLGPFGWPGITAKATDFPGFPGIYPWTVEYLRGGYLIYAAGITRRPMIRRFHEHTRNYLDGTYTLFDMEALQQGIRKEIWHGFWTGKRLIEKQEEYDRQKSALTAAARKQLAVFRVFAASIDTRPRLLERCEAAIMNELYRQPAPLADIPDRGMMLAPRWRSEMPLVIQNHCPVVLHGLPQRMTV